MNELDGKNLISSRQTVLDELSASIWGSSLFGGKITGALNSQILGNLSLAQLSQLFVTWRDATFIPINAPVRVALLESLLKGTILAIHPSHLQKINQVSASETMRLSDRDRVQAWLTRRISTVRQEAHSDRESKCWVKNTSYSPLLCGNAEDIARLSWRERSQQLQELKKQIESELCIEALPAPLRDSFRADWLPCVSLYFADAIKNNLFLTEFLAEETENFASSQWDVISTDRDVKEVVQQLNQLLNHPENYLSLVQIIDFDIEILRQEVVELNGDRLGLPNLADKGVLDILNSSTSTDPKVEKVLELLENSQALEDSSSGSEPPISGIRSRDRGSQASKSQKKTAPDAPVVLTGLPLPNGDPSVADRPTWRCVHTLTGHSDSVVSVVFDLQTADKNERSPYILVSGSWDKSTNIWQLKSSGRSLGLPHSLSDNSASIYSVAISSDRQFIATGCADRTVRLWHLPTSKRIHILTGHSVPIYSVAFSPDGELLASGSGDQTIKLWRVSTGELLGTLIGHSSFVYSVAFSPDGRLLVSGSTDKTIKIWQVKNQQLVRTLIGNSPVTSVSLDPKGHVLASGSRDETIKIWQIQGSASEGGTRPAPTRTLRGHTAEVLCVAINPRSPLLASGSHDKTIKLWHLETGELIGALSGHFDSVNAVAFSSDGRFLASASHDKTIKLWRPFSQ